MIRSLGVPLWIIARSTRRTPGLLRAAILGLVTWVGAGAPALSAQAVTGAGADAIPLPKGVVRLRIGGVWDEYTRVYTDTGSQPLRGALATSALGVRALPQLGAAEQAIRTLSGNATFSLSLGTLEASGDVHQTTTPMVFELGLTSRLSVGVLVPYVESRDNALLILNRAGTGATVGQNPARYGASVSAARSANGAVLREIAQARAQLNAEMPGGATASETGCAAIRANVSGAQQLAQQALATQRAIAALYGDSVRGGAPVVPISTSATQVAINTLIASMRTAFVDFGVTSLSGALPSGAVVVSGPGAIPRIAADSVYGLDYQTLGGTRRAGIGDVDATATFLWLNTLGARPSQWLGVNRFGLRSQVTGGWRFGVAGADRTNTAFDVPIGDGTNALLLRSTTDIVLNRVAWLSGTIRLVQPFSDQLLLRRPLFADSALFVPSTVTQATRTLGRRVEVEIAPRLNIGKVFGLSAGYLLRQFDADRYEFAARDSTPATSSVVDSRRFQGYMIGATFSTLSSYVRNRSKWPLEVLFVHTAPISGGAGVPAASTDRLELRIYTGFPRR